MNDLVSELIQGMIFWKTDVKTCYLQVQRKSSRSTHPRTDQLGFSDCLVDNLSDLESSMPAFPWMKYQIRRDFKDLESCRSLLNDILREHTNDHVLDIIVSELTQVAYEVEYVAVGHINTCTDRFWILGLNNDIKQKSLKIRDSNNNRAGNPSGASDCLLLQPMDNNNIMSTHEMVVAMKEHEEKVINQPTRGSTKFGTVSVVGRGGLGKTTLAKKVFDSPSVSE